MAFPIEKHLDGRNNAELLNFKLNPQATDPGTPVVGVPWYNTAENVFKYYDGTATQILATLGELTSIGRYRGAWDATQGVPTAAGSSNYPGDAIRGGDFWRVSVGGAIAGILGETNLDAGDLIFADVPNAVNPGDFFGANTNVEIAATTQGEQVFTGINLVANTPLDVTGTTVTTITSYQILNGNKDLTSSFEIDVDDTTPKITILSLSDYNGLRVKLTGAAA